MHQVTIKKIKPRNPLVAASLFRKAGGHGPSTTARRQRADQALRRELSDWDRQRQSP